MASIIGQNIGGNPRGILNLGATINTPLDTTLRSVTDGLGNNSTLQLSTTEASITQSGINRLLIATDITMRRNDNTIFLNYSNAPDILELNGNTLRLNNLRGNTVIGHTAASARLHVRGDGTNPIARFETSGGTASHIFKDTTALEFGTQGNYIAATANGSTTSTAGRGLLFSGVSGQSIYQFNFLASNNSESSGTWGGINLTGGVTAGAGSGNFRPLAIAYTINNSGAQTGTATGIFLNATETALNGMGHNLMDLQVGGVSQFRVGRTGGAVANSFTGTSYFSLLSEQRLVLGIAPNRTILISNGDSILTLLNGAENNFNRLNLGGTTNAFPAIKRNGAAIDFRLADDSSYCSIEAGGDSKFRGTLRVLDTAGNNAMIMYGDGLSGTRTLWVNGSVGVGVLGNNASARLQVDSTTQGFLPPRGNNGQMLAIASPAAGLMFYDTTNNTLNYYNGTTWISL